ncbi:MULTISPECIES: DUF397 domain-containing protein [unclassified Streptomyces]|uniref:DUF397 domain-containing protein n=1 Tax=unclassified Streptomyces TaxID=2593676 RepID=UPI0003A6E30B|nr:MULTISPECIES: DUF397 domain-containing protein [unclassified Streptomyces]MYX25628.1 DUF397 domain-containing protein [Streptomyces sp. SID8381]
MSAHSSEPTLNWFKSSHSAPDGAACVEIALTSASVHVRDSKALQGPDVAFRSRPWTTFINTVEEGENK